MPSRMSGSFREAFPDVRECWEGPPVCLVVVGRPSRISGRPTWMSWRPSFIYGRGREALSYVREWVRGPPECLGVFGRHSRMSGSCREAIPYVR